MDDSIKHSNDEEVCAVTYTWGQVKTFLKEHGRCATDANAEALLAECGCGNIEGGKDNLFCDAYDEIEQCLYTSLTTASLPDKPWYDRPNGVWVYNREKPADYHDDARTSHGMARTAISANIRAGTNAGAATPAHNAEGTCARRAPSDAPRAAASSATMTRMRPRTANGSASNATASTIPRKAVCSTPSKTIRARYAARRPRTNAASSSASSTASEIPHGRNQPEARRRAERHQTARQGTEEPWKRKRLRHAGRHHLL